MNLYILNVSSSNLYSIPDGYDGVNLVTSQAPPLTNVTLTMPSSPSQFSSVLIVSDIQINNLLIQPNAGQTFLLPPPGSIVVGGVALYSFIGTQWTPI